MFIRRYGGDSDADSTHQAVQLCGIICAYDESFVQEELACCRYITKQIMPRFVSLFVHLDY